MEPLTKRVFRKIGDGQYLMEIVLLTICLVLAFTAPRFFTPRNLLNVMRNVSMQGVIAFGMTMVIISGEIDLSVGSAVAFSGSLAAYFVEAMVGGGMNVDVSVLIAIVAVVVLGFCIGNFIALMRTRFAVPTFITSLALMTVLSGIANLVTDGFPITSFPEWYRVFGGGVVFGFPIPAIIFSWCFYVSTCS